MAPSRTGVLASYGVHTENAWFAIVAGTTGALLGAAVAPVDIRLPWAILVGVFAALVVLWARDLFWQRLGFVLLGLAALAMVFSPSIAVVALPSALAIATSPGRRLASWLSAALVTTVVTWIPLVAFPAGPLVLAAVLACAAAIVAIGLSHRIA